MRRPTSLASAVILLALSLATPSAAGCREDDHRHLPITPSARPRRARVELAVTLRSAQAKPIRLIDGKFGLRDSLGGAIGSFRSTATWRCRPAAR